MQINFVWAEFSGYIYNFYYGRSGKDYEFKWPDENRSREKSVVAGRQVRIWRNIQNLEKYTEFREIQVAQPPYEKNFRQSWFESNRWKANLGLCFQNGSI